MTTGDRFSGIDNEATFEAEICRNNFVRSSPLRLRVVVRAALGNLRRIHNVCRTAAMTEGEVREQCWNEKSGFLGLFAAALRHRFPVFVATRCAKPLFLGRNAVLSKVGASTKATMWRAIAKAHAIAGRPFFPVTLRQERATISFAPGGQSLEFVRLLMHFPADPSSNNRT